MATPLRLERGWVPPQYPKSASDRADIRRAIRHNCLFSNLDEQAMAVMIDAMQRFHFEHGTTGVYVSNHFILTGYYLYAGEVLIHQGDEGDQFFVLASGAADVFIHGQRVGGVEADTTANFCGELALLYDSPRAATVKVTTPDVVAWGVDRVTFKKVLMDTTIKQRKLYEAFVDEVPILSELTKYERLTLVDALRPVFYEQGQPILEEGSQSNDFYIVSDGEVTCTKHGEEVSRRLGSGDYFGEIALLSDEVRQATVRTLLLFCTMFILMQNESCIRSLLPETLPC
ncbi:hypothetical protein DYB38_006882 [Aphanomyces astaci]|uniref:Cyclic nucleotide-binding domain-containing protein n=1 Tax=Aphanomyces astaci TaxID=112090 RepID=A0A397D422_APHAT|nr:hypothetical protein DYB38_006882 [Aphanomyces astaci]